MTTEIESFVTKLGTANGIKRKRIWIEGERLQRNGFPRGTVYVRDWNSGTGHLSDERVSHLFLSTVRPDDILLTKPYKVSGKAEHPTIDIVSMDVPTFFDGFEYVKVEFQSGIIRITGHKEC